MPAKIFMNLSNENRRFAPQVQQKQGIQPSSANPSLHAKMIQRIHTVKPGCGSCGKH
jgi:hypothetical protein